MNNHCAYCYGKFGLVRHRRAFKAFCSQICMERYKLWLRTARKRGSWVEYLWSASLNFVAVNQRDGGSKNHPTLIPLHSDFAGRRRWGR